MTELFVTIKYNGDDDNYYIVPFTDASFAFNAELENHMAMEGPGTTVTFEIAEMSRNEYLKIPKYEGNINRGGYDLPPTPKPA